MLVAAVDFESPLFWAVFLAWILSVVLHEFAHGIVAYRGGDYTIRERGGLTLNPLQYVDPMMSLILPMVFLIMGGVPLPGGATYIRRELLRSKGWDSAVSAAGPAMNLVLFLILAMALHPRVGWVDPTSFAGDWTTAQKFVGALGFLQLFSVFLNLVPIPPLDGFQILAPFMNPETRDRLMTPQVSMMLFIGFFLLLRYSERTQRLVFGGMENVTDAIGVDYAQLAQAFHAALWGG